MENFLNLLLPYVVTAIGGYLTVKIVKIVPSIISYIIAKVGVINYNKMKAIGLDIWGKIEEDSRLGELANTKIKTFEALIKAKFPAITDEDINLLNKSIAHEFNKDKSVVEKATQETEKEVIVSPVTKYVSPEGIELQPVISETTAQ